MSLLSLRHDLNIAAVTFHPIYPLLTAISAQAVILPSFRAPKHVFVARRIILIKEKLHCSILALVYFHSIISYILHDNAEQKIHKDLKFKKMFLSSVLAWPCSSSTILGMTFLSLNLLLCKMKIPPKVGESPNKIKFFNINLKIYCFSFPWLLLLLPWMRFLLMSLCYIFSSKLIFLLINPMPLVMIS